MDGLVIVEKLPRKGAEMSLMFKLIFEELPRDYDDVAGQVFVAFDGDVEFGMTDGWLTSIWSESAELIPAAIETAESLGLQISHVEPAELVAGMVTQQVDGSR